MFLLLLFFAFYHFKEARGREKIEYYTKAKKYFKAATLPHRTGFVSI